MPTVTDPKTGETREISMEEFMEKIRGGGKISVRQEVHHADGTVTSSMIYGNDERDGIDRSINIFGTLSDVLKPVIMRAAKIKETDKDAEKIFFMDNCGADYAITVDDTESPLMHIVTCTKEEVRVARYIRDEQKSVGRPIAENTYKFNDGKLSATLDEVQEGNKLLLVAVGVYELRRIFEERGILQELKKLDNCSSGVVVTSKDDEISTRIVRGRNRPDLPCLLFGGLFGQGIEDATMMRPYMDEMLGDTLRAGMSVDDMTTAAEEGDIDCMESLATLYLNGDDDTKPNPEKSVYWLQKMADAGSSVGMFNLGLHYAKGHGVKRDFLKAVEWMKKAAAAGDEDAPEAAARYQKIADSMKLAENGDAQAMADLAGGLMEMGGSLEQAGPGEDYKEAFKWAKKAADLDNGDGIWTLALAYEHGRGVKQDIDKAVELYKHGAELGHAKSQNSYGAYLIRGDHGEKSPKKGFALCLAAAEKGEPLAMQNVGRCYQFATGVTGNMKTAIEWYEKSLQYLDDPEMEQKVAIFKSIDDPHFDEDYGDPGYDDDEPMPDQEFNLTFTKKGDRKERSNRLKTRDKVTFKYEKGIDKVVAYTSLGDIGEISGASWVKTMLDKKIPYKAELSEVISYDQLTNKRQNPTVKVRLHFDKNCGEMRSAMGWDDIPGSIFDSGTSGYLGDANDVIRQNLEAAGKPADDESISNLSYDEALDAYMGVSDDAENFKNQDIEKENAERKEEEEERKRKEAEKKAAEEKARKKREEAEKKAAEEKARKEREEAEKRLKEEAEKRRKEEERLKAAEAKKKRPERIRYLEYASGMISASLYALAYVKPDGTVGSFSNYSNIGGKGAPGDTSSFSNIKSIVCTEDGIVGLRNNGTCIATKPGFTYAYIGECNRWKDIVTIAAGDHQVVGLKKDGTCVANSIKWNTGYGYDGQSNVSGWRDIVALACFDNISMGLRSDGTVALACTDEFAKVESVTEWQNVEMIAAGYQSAVGLTKDGELLKTPKVSVSGIDPKKGIVRLMIHCGQAYALYVDGTVGGGTKGNSYGMNSTPMITEKNVIAMASNNSTIFVLTEDGRIHTYNQGFLLKTPDDIRIFDSYDRIMGARKLEEERQRIEAEEAAQKQAEEEVRRAERKAQGVCPYCGGAFKKGFLSTKCTSCGRKKDY